MKWDILRLKFNIRLVFLSRGFNTLKEWFWVVILVYMITNLPSMSPELLLSVKSTILNLGGDFTISILPSPSLMYMVQLTEAWLTKLLNIPLHQLCMYENGSTRWMFCSHGSSYTEKTNMQSVTNEKWILQKKCYKIWRS